MPIKLIPIPSQIAEFTTFHTRKKRRRWWLWRREEKNMKIPRDLPSLEFMCLTICSHINEHSFSMVNRLMTRSEYSNVSSSIWNAMNWVKFIYINVIFHWNDIVNWMIRWVCNGNNHHFKSTFLSHFILWMETLCQVEI